jgi:hypothetical protein
MKSIKEIENMSLEQLEAVSMDESIAVPEGFANRLENSLEGRKSKVKVVRFVAAAASVAVLAGVGFGIAKWQDEPKDTYDDPYLAYAELERAFEMISTGINQSLEMANSVISEK